MKKSTASLTLELTPNPDILLELGQRKKSVSPFPLLVGFAAESREFVDEGLRKLRDKNLDLIVINDIGRSDAGFASDTNQVILLDRDGGETQLPLLSKEETADHIWDSVLKLRNN